MAHTHTYPRQTGIQLDPGRILGLAGAMAANAAALMLLMAPVSAPLPIPETGEVIMIDFITPEEKKLPPKPPEPIELKVRPPSTQTPARQPIVQPQPDIPLVFNDPGPMDQPAPDIVATTTTPTGPVGPAIPTGPAEASALEYLAAPPPPYPPEAVRQQIEGVVTLRVLVDVDGTPLEVEIKRSSGNRRLDEAARRQILRKWRFKPAVRDGVAIQVYGVVPVEFSLQ